PPCVADPPGEPSAANALAVRPDGGAVTAGWAERSGRRVVELVGFLRGGMLDPAFGTGGIADLAVGSGDSDANAIARLDDGRLLVAGQTGDRSVLLRFLQNGALDLTFGTGGMVFGPPVLHARSQCSPTARSSSQV